MCSALWNKSQRIKEKFNKLKYKRNEVNANIQNDIVLTHITTWVNLKITFMKEASYKRAHIEHLHL